MGQDGLACVPCLRMTHPLGQEKGCSDGPGLGHRHRATLAAAAGISPPEVPWGLSTRTGTRQFSAGRIGNSCRQAQTTTTTVRKLIDSYFRSVL